MGRMRATKKIKISKRSKAVDWDCSKLFMHTRRRQGNPSCKNKYANMQNSLVFVPFFYFIGSSTMFVAAARDVVDWPSNSSKSEPERLMIVAAANLLSLSFGFCKTWWLDAS